MIKIIIVWCSIGYWHIIGILRNYAEQERKRCDAFPYHEPISSERFKNDELKLRSTYYIYNIYVYTTFIFDFHIEIDQFTHFTHAVISNTLYVYTFICVLIVRASWTVETAWSCFKQNRRKRSSSISADESEQDFFGQYSNFRQNEKKKERGDQLLNGMLQRCESERQNEKCNPSF